jgi:ubiquinone biosynthesis accessory factor UbiJ
MPARNPAAIPGAIVNRVLDRESWARVRLADFAGRLMVITVGPAATAFRIEESGFVASTALADSEPDLRLTVSLAALPSFLADPLRWDECVVSQGDPALAATLRDLAQTLPWLVERAFARLLGPIAGQRLADIGRRLLTFPEYAAGRIGDSMTSYARDEAGLLAGATAIHAFSAEANAIAARCDALADGIAALETRAERGSGN